MTIKDLKFRYYNGELKNPFADEDKMRFWDQERSVADRPNLAIEDFESKAWERYEDENTPPKAIMNMLGKVDDGSFAVALSGFLNTKQWGVLAWEYDDYFDAPVNGFVVRQEVDKP